ncbi:hypothetical protein M758_5G049600 [Ceratodon purpureus]|nr:hypothetical protein M758_5G049600 [Ceratodon purpureus]
MDRKRALIVSCGFLLLIVYLFFLLLVLLLSNGRFQQPRLELEGLTIDNFSLTKNESVVLDPWIANANIAVTLKPGKASARRHGFRHKYLSTIVSIYHEDAMWAQTIVPYTFTQKDGLSNTILSANLVVSDQHLNETTGSALQRYMQTQSSMYASINIDAYVQRKDSFGWHHKPRWYNTTCFVTASLPSNSEAGHLVSKLCIKANS